MPVFNAVLRKDYIVLILTKNYKVGYGVSQVPHYLFEINDDDIITKDYDDEIYENENDNEIDVGYYRYTIKPSNIKININLYEDDDEIGCSIEILTGKDELVTFYEDMTKEAAKKLVNILDKEIPVEKVKKLGRTIGMIPRIAPNENTDSVIASYLTGNTGSLRGQMNKLKMRTGIPLAPRAGGKRKTKKNRRN